MYRLGDSEHLCCAPVCGSGDGGGQKKGGRCAAPALFPQVSGCAAVAGSRGGRAKKEGGRRLAPALLFMGRQGGGGRVVVVSRAGAA